jgi:DNA-binding winged helix-turn-helix (wHTH) protein
MGRSPLPYLYRLVIALRSIKVHSCSFLGEFSILLMMCPDIADLLPQAIPADDTAKNAIKISATEARVFLNGDAAALSLKELALLVALARLQRPYHRDALCADLWPDSPREAAMNSLRVCVARVRKRLGFYNVILTAQEGFQLSPHVEVDLWHYAELHEAVRESIPPREDLRSRVSEAFRSLTIERPSQLSYWAWFADTNHRLRAYAETFGAWLIREAQNRGDEMAASAYARDLQLGGITAMPRLEIAEALA